MLISFAIPAYNASHSVDRTLSSIFEVSFPKYWKVEAVVVDDGSLDGNTLKQVVDKFANASLFVHSCNRGMCAARNTGISRTNGDYVCILDADDELVSGWPTILLGIINDCPNTCQVIYAACRNQFGIVTASNPDYEGLLNLDDLLNERYAGEYLPIFRGEYVRNKLYIDLKTRKSCGVVSYINYAMDGPFWISSKVLRIYNEFQEGSVSSGWTKPSKASETVCCYQVLLERYGDLYRKRAPVVYLTKVLRLSVYLKLAKQSGVWSTYIRGASLIVWKESLGVALMLLLGSKASGFIAAFLKKVGLLRRYG
jgi:glycosyltransferase involved in cell wall biosynthesis